MNPTAQNDEEKLTRAVLARIVEAPDPNGPSRSSSIEA